MAPARGAWVVVALVAVAAVATAAQAGAPGPPENLTAAPGSSAGEVTLTWDPPSDDGGSAITTYRVYRANDSSGPYEQVGEVQRAMAAGNVTVDGATSVRFDEPMNATPIVFVQTQLESKDDSLTTSDGPSWVTTVEDVETDRFTIRYCEQETENGCDGDHPSHDVAWWAIDPSRVADGDAWEWGRFATANDSYEQVSFDPTLDATPALISNLQTHDGSQKALYAEARDVDGAGAEVRFCESDGDNGCDGHVPETMAWLAAEPGNISLGDAPLGEAGRMSGLGDDTSRSVDLQASYHEDPLVFTTTQTENGAQDPSHAAVHDISAGGFQTFHCEYEAANTCDSHSKETNGWVSIDPGRIPRTSWTDANLTHNATYHYQVTAVNPDGESTASGSDDAVPLPTPAENVTAEPGPDVDEITLDWEPANATVEGYRVYHNPDAAVRENATLVADTTATSFVHGNRSEGTIHHYWVASYNQDSEHDVYVEGEAPHVPDPPTSVTADGGDGNVSLSWKPPDDDGGLNVTGYRVYRSNASTSESLVADLGPTLNHTDTGLADNTTYTYRLSAVNDLGEGPKGSEVQVTTDSTPWAPKNLTATTGPDRGEITLAWDPPEDDGGADTLEYNVYRRNASTNESLVAELEGQLEHVDGGLADGTNYTYRVSAESDVGEGDKSAEAEASAPPRPEAPAAFGVSAGPADDEITVDWARPRDDDGAEILGYNVYRSSTSGGPYDQVAQVEGGMAAGTVTVENSADVFFDEAMAETPLVFVQPQLEAGSRGDPSWVTTVEDVSKTGFEVRFCEQEDTDSCDWGHGSHEVAWWAIDPASAKRGDVLDWGAFTRTGEESWWTVTFDQDFDAPPVVVANLQTKDGHHDALYAEVRDVTTDQAQVRFCESEGGDACDGHTSEEIAWVAVEPGPVLHGAGSMGEAGLATDLADDDPQAVDLDVDFEETPLVFSTTQTENGGENPSHAVVQNATRGGFETFHCEYEQPDDCDTHPEEANGWVALDPTRIPPLIYKETGVTEDESWYYQVRAETPYLESPATEEGRGVAVAPPENVSSAQGPEVDQISLDWEPADGNVDGYRVYHNPDAAVRENATLLAEPNGTELVHDGVSPGTFHRYWVASHRDGGENPDFEKGEAPHAPEPPTDLAAERGVAEITLTWNPPEDDGSFNVTGYKVYRWNASTSETLVAELGTKLEYTDTGLANDTAYTYGVSAVNDVGEGAKAEAEASTAGPPDPPENLTAAPGPGGGEATVTWDPPADDGGTEVTGYHVYRSPDDTDGSYHRVAAPSNTSWVDGGLDPNTTYHYRTAAVNVVGEGPNATAVNATTYRTPNAPENLTAAPGPGGGEVTLAWERPSESVELPVTDYRIYRANDPSGPYEQVGTTPRVSDDPGVPGMRTGTVVLDSAARIDFDEPTNETPLVFVQPQLDSESMGEPSWVTTVEAVNETGFTVRFCEQETTDGCDDTHPDLEVAWWAIDPDAAERGDTLDWGTFSKDGIWWHTVFFDQSFTEPPVVVANLQTHNGNEKALYAEVRDVTTDQAGVRFCEYEGDDYCNGHTDETVAWFAVEPGTVSSAGIDLGEAGRTTDLDDDLAQPADLLYPFETTPHVFATTQTENGSQNPSNPVVQDVTEGGFETWHCEYERPDNCDTHANETNGWVAVDPPATKDQDAPVTFSDSGLQDNETYHYKVAAVNDAGVGPNTTVVEERAPAPPGPPQNPSAQTGDKQGTIRLEWERPAFLGGLDVTYRVYQVDEGTGDEALLADLANVTTFVASEDPDGTPYPDNTSRTFRISAVNPAGESILSYEVSARTPDPPDPPRNVTAEETFRLGEILVEWDPPTEDPAVEVDTYWIYRTGPDGWTTTIRKDGDTTTHRDQFAPDDDREYTYRVTAENHAGEGKKSEPASSRPYPWDTWHETEITRLGP